ncbi:hypothetical protein CCR75_003534 [Bremia lactucae]|uniref:Polynucleotide adenylyltransferase n=1 Tax=Bremia lactucae TaxID=4779 RepID=A0A976IHC6_BRELC|nr:hypothetical protein CCR75_003534 [Bremia lactucae]
MKRQETESPTILHRKKRRGRRKSKAERLTRSISEIYTNDGLTKLLEGSSSCEWDAAQSLAQHIGTPDARATVVRVILMERAAPRAAAHYAKRLNFRGDELLTAILPTLMMSPPPPLLLAQFLVELDEDLLATDERLKRFLWPWLLLSLENKKEGAAVKAAVNLLLHPTLLEGSKTEEKRERGRRLERALVVNCLKTGQLLHLVPIHSRAFVGQLSSVFSPHPENEHVAMEFAENVDDELQRRLEVACRVQDCLRLLWPDARVLVFGSSVTGLLSRSENVEVNSSDVDLCALLPSALLFRQNTASLVTDVKEHLSLYLVPDENEVITAVTGARIPIVHFFDPRTSLPCDLCVNNVPAIWNTRLLRWFLHGGVKATPFERKQLAHVRQLCKWLRYWRQVKKRVVAGALSSYGLVLLAIYFLQRVNILPVIDCSAHATEDEATLRTLSDKIIDEKLDAVDKVFVNAKDHESTCHHWQDLRQRFFYFYTCEFDYEHTVVSIRTKEIMLKTSKGWSRQKNNRLCVEDPIEIDRDLGGLCSKRSLGRLRCAFAHAWIVLSDFMKTKSVVGVDPDLEADLVASWMYEDENLS